MISRRDFTEKFVERVDYFDWYHEIDAATDDPKLKMALVNVIRQAGKSSWALSNNAPYNLFNIPRWQGAGIASSKDTFKAIFRQKIADIINRSPRLKKDAKVFDSYCSVPRLGSYFEIFPAESVGAVVGRSLNSIYIDEAALTSDEVIATLLPSVMAQENCKIIATSSSWAPRGWFYELIQSQEEEPDPQVFMFRSNRKDLNPYAKMENLDFMSKMLMRINPAYEKRFLSTEFCELGDEFLPRKLIDSCIDNNLTNKETSNNSCYAFLDLSLKRDLTSRVIVEADSDNFSGINIQVFDPKDFANHRIDFDKVKEMIKDDYLNFRIRKYLIDERAEAGELIQWCQSKGYYLEPFLGSVKSNMQIWGRLCELFQNGKLKIPNNRRLLNELYNLRIEEFSFGQSFRIVDSKKKYHRDISMSLAGAAWAASEDQASSGPFQYKSVTKTCFPRGRVAW